MDVVQQYNQFGELFCKTRIAVWRPVKEFIDESTKQQTQSTKQQTAQQSTLLEVGSGSCQNLAYATTKGFDCIGVDASTTMVRIGRQKGFCIEERNILNLQMNKKFDRVLCIAVFHHLVTKEERERALQQLYGCLAADGKLLLSVWSKDHFKPKRYDTVDENGNAQIAFTVNGIRYMRYYHLFVSGEFEQFLKESGVHLTIEQSELDNANLYYTLVHAH